MRIPVRSFLALYLLFGMLAPASLKAAYIYSLAGVDGDNFQVTVPVLLTTNTIFTAATWDSCTDSMGPCQEIDFLASALGVSEVDLKWSFEGANQRYYYFFIPPVSSAGVYLDGGDSFTGTLTVQGGTPSTPEPSTVVMVLAGLTLFGLRRFARMCGSAS